MITLILSGTGFWDTMTCLYKGRIQELTTPTPPKIVLSSHTSFPIQSIHLQGIVSACSECYKTSSIVKIVQNMGNILPQKNSFTLQSLAFELYILHAYSYFCRTIKTTLSYIKV